MPSTVQPPSYQSCHPCKYFHDKLWMSGLHPIYHSMCEHPTNLHEGMFGEEGRFIGENTDHRPDWCPLRNDTNAESDAMRDEEDE